MYTILSFSENYDLPMSRDTKPAAINGPTGTPRNNDTPNMVPISNPVTNCGWFPINTTPRPPNQEAKTPTPIATNDFLFVNECSSVEVGKAPLAMGAYRLFFTTLFMKQGSKDGINIFLVADMLNGEVIKGRL